MAMTVPTDHPPEFARYSDEKLARLAPHTPSAADVLFVRHLDGVRQRISRWARRYGIGAHVADAQQDAVFALHAAIHHYRPCAAGQPGRRFTAYLAWLLRNRFCNYCRGLWRAEGRRERDSAAEGILDTLTAPCDPCDPLHVAQRHETQTAVAQAVSRLPPFEQWLCMQVAAGTPLSLIAEQAHLPYQRLRRLWLQLAARLRPSLSPWS
jgi:RNA polymerase sigma factor (sigma-70 family)